MKYFIDGGACNGGSAAAFRGWRHDSKEYKIICFEPNPALHPKLLKLGGVCLQKEAIWTENGTLPFYIGKNIRCSSVYEDRERAPHRIGVEVPCIDFSQWLAATFSPDDEVILKLDIECAEFPVLAKMVDDGSFDLVDQLYVEFHHHRFPKVVEPHKEDYEKILAYIESRGLPLYYWEAGKKPPARPYSEKELVWDK